jgi:hypothetical protein
VASAASWKVAHYEKHGAPFVRENGNAVTFSGYEREPRRNLLQRLPVGAVGFLDSLALASGGGLPAESAHAT